NPNDVWNFRNLGPVFGVTLDRYDPPNIYVAASPVYGPLGWGPGGSGCVYKLSGATNAISQFAVLPNANCGLGDVEWDRYHERFLVSNLEDGKIYGYDKNGALKQVFDPFGVNDASNDGPIPLATGSRVWALRVYTKRALFFSVWLRDAGRPDTPWPPMP